MFLLHLIPTKVIRYCFSMSADLFVNDSIKFDSKMAYDFNVCGKHEGNKDNIEYMFLEST